MVQFKRSHQRKNLAQAALPIDCLLSSFVGGWISLWSCRSWTGNTFLLIGLFTLNGIVWWLEVSNFYVIQFIFSFLVRGLCVCTCAPKYFVIVYWRLVFPFTCSSTIPLELILFELFIELQYTHSRMQTTHTQVTGIRIKNRTLPHSRSSLLVLSVTCLPQW